MKHVKGERQAIHTSTWFTPLPAGFQRVGISLYPPRGFKGEHWNIKQLAPGPWFKTSTAAQYIERFSLILHALNPGEIRDALFSIGPNPVMVCYEKPEDIHAGTKFCHRHMVAQWLNERCGMDVREVGHPDLNPWKAFQRLKIDTPTYL